MIPRQCSARIISDVQDASPFPCANWILRQFPGGQRPCAGQHDLHPGHARGDCRIPLFGGCVLRAVCSLWRVALLGGWCGKANGRRSVLGVSASGAAAGELVAILVMSANLASRELLRLHSRTATRGQRCHASRSHLRSACLMPRCAWSVPTIWRRPMVCPTVTSTWHLHRNRRFYRACDRNACSRRRRRWSSVGIIHRSDGESRANFVQPTTAYRRARRP